MNRLGLGRLYVHRLDLNVENAVLQIYALLHLKKLQVRNQHPANLIKGITFYETRYDKSFFSGLWLVLLFHLVDKMITVFIMYLYSTNLHCVL